MPRRAIRSIALVAVALALTACDRKGGSSSGGPPPPGAVPGHLRGRLADAQGKPLSNVTVSIFGFSDGGEPVTRDVQVTGPATSYDIELPPGKCNTPIARIDVLYNDRRYVLPLAAADGTIEWAEQQSARVGMVRDFVWRISGPVPNADPAAPTGYWGGAVQFDKGQDLGDTAKIEITLKPDGPLIDGSAGRELTFERKIPWKRQEDHLLLDIPIGRYTVAARLLFGTNPKALRLVAYTLDPKHLDLEPPKPATTVKLEFECGEVKPGEFKLMVPNLIAFPPA